mmetsp:Transcript_15375/g.35438  ORF Transcript_15375/g.35438 Transcript_15375/m.35438 type:complete len:148 (-) Transcript_15375:72-515(-)
MRQRLLCCQRHFVARWFGVARFGGEDHDALGPFPYVPPRDELVPCDQVLVCVPWLVLLPRFWSYVYPVVNACLRRLQCCRRPMIWFGCVEISVRRPAEKKVQFNTSYYYFLITVTTHDRTLLKGSARGKCQGDVRTSRIDDLKMLSF